MPQERHRSAQPERFNLRLQCTTQDTFPCNQQPRRLHPVLRNVLTTVVHVTEIELRTSDALVSSEFWQIAGDAGAGTLMTFSPDPRLNKTAAEVVKVFKDKSIDPEGYVLYTYAAIQIWADAVKKAKTTDPKKVAAALKATGNWPSVLGPTSFDKKGDPTGSGYVLYIWKNGSYAQM